MKSDALFDGRAIPALGLGTWEIGGRTSPDYSRDRGDLEALRAALELGYRHIDTAEVYGGGHAEELIGRAIKAFRREELFITTKVSPEHLHAQEVLRTLEGSLRRLQTDCVDLYLIHWPNARIPLEETFRGLNELVRRGVVRYLGVSNFNLAQLKKAQAFSETPIVTNQVPYSLRDRGYARNGVLEYCQREGIILTAYSPLKGGVLKQPAVRQVAEKLKATPAQVALAWLIGQARVITIPKSDKHKHLEENLGALEIELSAEDVERLDRIA
ncbi:MAG TPA: aldo/keto reductase [Anaerolineales bacterium]|nr:aldo/keto reductase [Anaerolineales bacterium]